MTPSKYQQDIFDEIQNGTSNVMIEAVAGSGKTTTIVKALGLLDPSADVAFFAFNKHIADELKTRVPANVNVATLNGFGWRVCRREWPGAVLNADKTKLIVKKLGLPWGWTGAVVKLVGLIKAVGGCADANEVLQVADRYGVDVPNAPDFAQGVMRVFIEGRGMTSMMDFDDQIFMPVVHDCTIPLYDVVMVDETQDLTATQVKLVSRAGKRVIAVGDRRQAIYGFRGADPSAMPSMAEELKMKVMPLSICYRCPKTHVAQAKLIVNSIEASPTAEDGEVVSVKYEKLFEMAVIGDYVLCRTTAPLVSACLKFLGKKIRAVVKGRDFGVGLVGLIRKLAPMGRTNMDGFLMALREYTASEVAKLAAADRDTQPALDKEECLVTLSDGVADTDGLIAQVESIFSDTDAKNGITLCTVHRSKGLEGDCVYIIKPELMPFPIKKPKPWQVEQEMNLKYVALTRAKKKLVFCT